MEKGVEEMSREELVAEIVRLSEICRRVANEALSGLEGHASHVRDHLRFGIILRIVNPSADPHQEAVDLHY